MKPPIQADQPVYFWGFGPLLAACFDELCSMVGRLPEAILDSDAAKVGASIGGVACHSPERMAAAQHPIVVITARRHQPIAAAIKQYNPTAQIYVVNFQLGFHKAIALVPEQALSTTQAVAEHQVSFTGKKALVTGASKGIGQAIARQLAALGFDLILVSRHQADLQTLATPLRDEGHEVQTIAADLSTEQGLASLLQHPALSQQPVDVLFNNAGVSFKHRDSLKQAVNYEEMRYGYALNVIAPVAIAEHCLRLASAHRPLRIINVSSNADTPENTAYTLTKAALNRYTFDSFGLYQRHHADLYLFDPGDVQTPMNPHGSRAVETIFPAALMPLYCRPGTRAAMLHATEFSGLSPVQAMSLLLHKYPEQWRWEPIP